MESKFNQDAKQLLIQISSFWYEKCTSKDYALFASTLTDWELRQWNEFGMRAHQLLSKYNLLKDN